MSRFPTAGLRAPRVARLAGLGAGPKDPLKPEELPAGILYIHPRYVVNKFYEFLDMDEPMSWFVEAANDPPDWVKAKANKIGQDSYRLAAWLRSRLNYRLPTTWDDYSTIDSDAALVIEGRWKYNDLSMETLAEWATNPPNWKPWNRSGDITAVIMPAILWARKVASARAGVDIPFFVDSTVENLTDQLVEANNAAFLGVLEVICNVVATLGAGAAASGGAAAAKEGAKEAGKEAVKEVAKKSAVDTVKEAGKTYVTNTVKTEAKGAIREAARENIDSKTGQEVAIAVGSGAVAGGAAFLAATPPVGWVAIGILALAPILCWGLKEVALKYIKDNLRDVSPGYVPEFISTVYMMRFNALPTEEQVAELDQRYAGLISANSIAKAVASPENDPAIIDAVSARQKMLRDLVNSAVGKLMNCKPNPISVANLVNRAFNELWDEKKIVDYVSQNWMQLCTPVLNAQVYARTAALRTTFAANAVGRVSKNPPKPLSTAVRSPATPKGGVIKKTLKNPPKKQTASGGIGFLVAGGLGIAAIMLLSRKRA